MLWIVAGLFIFLFGSNWHQTKRRWKWEEKIPKFAWLLFLAILLIEPILSTLLPGLLPSNILESIVVNGFEGGCFYIGLLVSQLRLMYG